MKDTDIKLECSLEVVNRSSLTPVITLKFGSFGSIRKMETIRQLLVENNPDYIFLSHYEERFVNLDDVCKHFAKNNDIEL